MKINPKIEKIKIKIGIIIIEEIKKARIEKNIPIKGNIIVNKTVKAAIPKKNRKNIN
jgi:hypothetical protein